MVTISQFNALLHVIVYTIYEHAQCINTLVTVFSFKSKVKEILRIMSNQSLCIALSVLLVMWSLSVVCAQTVEQNLQRIEYRIVSEYSGKYVAVIRGGRVHAHANNPSKFIYAA